MKILLTTSTFFKAEGSIAKGIAKAINQHEVYFFSTLDIKYRQKEFEYLLNHVDVVHWLFNVAHLSANYLNLYFINGKVPRIATVHHVCPEEINKVVVASKADIIHVVSSEWQDFVAEHTRTKVFIANLGINQDNFASIKSQPYVSGTFKIGMMGFYPGKYNRKRPDLAIDVFRELKRRQFDFEVVLQGVGWEMYLPALRKHNIRYKHLDIKSGDAILNFFEQIDLYLCTSDFEGGPLPVIESLQSEVPVVSTDIGIARDALKQGGGILVSKGDVNALCMAIQEIQSDKGLYNRLRKEAKLIAQKFHWENVIAEYENIYTQAIIEWEYKNKHSWLYKENLLSSYKQREVAIAYDKLFEGMSALYNENKKKGIQLLYSAILNRHISVSRKVDTIKKVFGFFVYRSKNLIRSRLKL